MTFQDTLAAFIAAPTLANAKQVAAHPDRPSDAGRMPTAEIVRNAERIVAEAKNPAKIREAMQRELRARYPGMNIEVI